MYLLICTLGIAGDWSENFEEEEEEEEEEAELRLLSSSRSRRLRQQFECTSGRVFLEQMIIKDGTSNRWCGLGFISNF